MHSSPRIKTFELKPKLDVLQCKACQLSSPEMTLVNRPKASSGSKRHYEYQCPECGGHETYAEKFPRIRYERVYSY